MLLCVSVTHYDNEDGPKKNGGHSWTNKSPLANPPLVATCLLVITILIVVSFAMFARHMKRRRASRESHRHLLYSDSSSLSSANSLSFSSSVFARLPNYNDAIAESNSPPPPATPPSVCERVFSFPREDPPAYRTVNEEEASDSPCNEENGQRDYVNDSESPGSREDNPLIQNSE